MPSERFEVTYEVDRWDISGSLNIGISEYEFGEDTPAEELSQIFWRLIDHDMHQRVHAVCDQEAEFIAWAKERQAAMRAKDERAG